LVAGRLRAHVDSTPPSIQLQPARYSRVAIALHWLLALLIVGAFSVGVYMSELPLSPTRLKLYNWHKWAGVTILALSICAPGLAPDAPPPPDAAHAGLAGTRRACGACCCCTRCSSSCRWSAGPTARRRVPHGVVRRAAAARLRAGGQGAGRGHQALARARWPG
jgi:hypothetical protein